MKRLLFLIIPLFALSCLSDTQPESKENKPKIEVEAIAICGNSRSIEADALFKNNCAQCHDYDKIIEGPALRYALDRWETKERLIGYMTNEDSMVSINDPYTLEIIKFSPTISRHAFYNFTNEELNLIIDICSN
jgi:hypothetical protein